MRILTLYLSKGKTTNPTKGDYEELVSILSKETGLPISIDCHYKFLVLLPLEADEMIEVLKHYFGITYDDELVVRGIEIRRHDSPSFIKQFQTQLLYTLFDCKDSDEVVTKGYEDALLLVTQAIDKIMTGEGILQQDLVISKLLRQNIDKYRSIFPHVSAAIQLSNNNNKIIVMAVQAGIRQKATLSSISIQTHSITILFAGLYL